MRLSSLLLSILLAAPLAQAALPPIANFFNNPKYTKPQLSPSGRYLAVKIQNEQGRDGLVVIDLKEMSARGVAHFSNADIDDVLWVNDERLAYDTTDKRIGVGKRMFGPGLFAVNRDGSNSRQLVALMHEESVQAVQAFKVKPRELLTPNHFMLGQVGRQDNNEVYVIKPSWASTDEITHTDLVKVDTLTGRSATVPRPAFAQHWMLDQAGEPRLAMSEDKDKDRILYRDPATDSWRSLIEFDSATGLGGFNPLAFGPDDTLYVTTSSGDKQAIHSYDLKTNQLSKEPLVVLKDFDFRGGIISSNGKLLGVRFIADAEAIEWFDPAMRELQKTIDAALPGAINLVSVGSRSSTPWVLIDSFSDVQPHHFFVYNRDSKEFVKIGATLSGLDPAQLGRMSMVRYKARDGLDIPAWLTMPRGAPKAAKPMVVLVHGGPFLRGASWDFDAQVQFLASRGYAVLQPEFRGSKGYGFKHFQAGWKQWGLAMQNDIADGVRWAIAQGYADPKRICIAGASYGGYATLMGLVNDPDLYKCGIDWAGVTDINLMYNGHWSFDTDLAVRYKEYGMPVLVGDQIKDAAQLKATSPLQQAARITQPLLLAYGGSDLRVPIYHGEKFYQAVKAGNPKVEWITYPEEGHGWALPQNRIDFWSRVEAFLAKHIGQP